MLGRECFPTSGRHLGVASFLSHRSMTVPVSRTVATVLWAPALCLVALALDRAVATQPLTRPAISGRQDQFPMNEGEPRGPDQGSALLGAGTETRGLRQAPGGWTHCLDIDI